MPKRIAILGSTGSVGKQALQVIDALGPEYQVVALTANSNTDLLARQAKKYKPKVVGLTDDSVLSKLTDTLGNLQVEVLTGPDSLVQIAQLDDADLILTAVVGAAGLPAVLAAAEKAKTIAIANKEPLAIAGELLMDAARRNNAEILPVDSEHSAIFQALQAGRKQDVRKIILTSSGGPFRKVSAEDIENVTIEQALAHPVWSMGPKITIDSATMMNKAIEVIEAHWLFDIGVDDIEVLIHPESIVHSLVEFVDGSVIAQLGTPDMSMPIQYALTYPARAVGIAKHLKLDELGKLTFAKPNLQVFKALTLGFEVARAGGTAPVVFNAANEVAVEHFLAGRIKFAAIVELIEACLDKHDIKAITSLEELLEADTWAREQVQKSISKKEHKYTRT
ncbi:1-deoxy-D-xylulose-5-phosphate reductoisomerase [Planctomycetota bacterium]